MVPHDESYAVEISVHAEDNLPREALSVLISLVLVPSPDLALQRLDALQLLLDEWDDLESSSDYADWAYRLGAIPLTVCHGEDGTLERSDDANGEPVVPASTIEVLTRTIIDRESTERIRAIEGFRELLAEWAPYFDDEEKLLGHLLRAHNAGTSAIRLGQDEMLRHHSYLHQAKSDSE